LPVCIFRNCNSSATTVSRAIELGDGRPRHDQRAGVKGLTVAHNELLHPASRPIEAQILDGEIPDDPAAFAKRLNGLVLRGVAPGA